MHTHIHFNMCIFCYLAISNFLSHTLFLTQFFQLCIMTRSIFGSCQLPGCQAAAGGQGGARAAVPRASLGHLGTWAGPMTELGGIFLEFGR